MKSNEHDLYEDTPINFQDYVSVFTMMLLTLAISGLSASSEPDEKSTCKNYIIIIKYFIVYLQTDSPAMKITKNLVPDPSNTNEPGAEAKHASLCTSQIGPHFAS